MTAWFYKNSRMLASLSFFTTLTVFVVFEVPIAVALIVSILTIFGASASFAAGIVYEREGE